MSHNNLPNDWLPPEDYLDQLQRPRPVVTDGIVTPVRSPRVPSKLASFLKGSAVLAAAAVVAPYVPSVLGLPGPESDGPEPVPAWVFAPGPLTAPSPKQPPSGTLTQPQPYILQEGQKIPKAMLHRPKASGLGEVILLESTRPNATEDLGVITSPKISRLLKSYLGVRSKNTDAGILFTETEDPTSPEIDLFVVSYTHGSHVVKDIDVGYKYFNNGHDKRLMPTSKLAKQLGIRLVGKMVNSGKSHSAVITVGGQPKSKPQNPQPLTPQLPGNPVPLPNAQDEYYSTNV